jgi:hypothetical protein
MAWGNYEEKDVRKTYENVGRVELSTEEYRDLVFDLYEARKDRDKEHDDWYKEYNKVLELEMKVKSLEKKVTTFEDFLSEHSSVKEDFENYKLRLMAAKNEE